VAFGRGSDSVTIQNGSSDDIDGGNGNETVFLGAGTVTPTPTAALCEHMSLPKPPAPGTERRGLLPRHDHELHV